MQDRHGETVPLFRPLQSVVAVACGGALGTLVRQQIVAATDGSAPTVDLQSPCYVTLCAYVPPTSLIPYGLIAINTAGVFVAAWLLSGPLRHRDVDDPWRLFAITGILGGLTSYSGLIRDLSAVRSHSLFEAALTLLSALVAGIAAAVCGHRLARR